MHAPLHAPLTHWLRMLWGAAPPLSLNSECAYIAGGTIHLPARPHWHHHAAAAAHAAAHLVYSPQRFDGNGLGPIARSLLALLEDARIEALAMRELPGLARLWRPLHTATPDSGVGFDGLAARLARSLCDPAYDDPDPWVRKGRDLCFLDVSLGVLAMRTPAELRAAATRLGHDIGQMRLPRGANACGPLPDYRDDHRWMWAADVLAAAPPTRAIPAGALPDPPDPPDSGGATVTLHPEWDRLIARLRPAWCRVIEAPAPDGGTVGIDTATRGMAQQLIRPVRMLTRRSAHPGRADAGEAFDLDALVHWQLGVRLRRPMDARVYRWPRGGAAPTALWLLVDQSASTAADLSQGQGSALRVAAQSVVALGLALRARGVSFGIAAFSSCGRHAVHWRTVKSFADATDEVTVARVQALRPEGSTRLGAILRHATHHLARHRSAQRWVVLLSDGRPHDVDVHEPKYLVEDARLAVSAGARRGVRMACLLFDPGEGGEVVRIFGKNGAARVQRIGDLPRSLQRLVA